jgi:hypothetical protein
MNNQVSWWLKRFPRQEEQGFAFPLALMIGFIMLGVGISMIAKSQSDQSKVISQRQKADGLSVAEVGLTDLQDTLDRYRPIAMQNSSTWADSSFQKSLEATIQDNYAKDCLNPNPSPDASKVNYELEKVQSLGKGDWIKVNSDYYYSVVNYDYVTKAGTSGKINGPKGSIVEAKALIDGSRGAAQSQSISRIEVTIPIISQRDPLFPRYNSTTKSYDNPYANNPAISNPNIPGLWIKEGATDDAQYPLYPENGNYKLGANFNAYVLMSERCKYEPALRDEIEEFVTNARIRSQGNNFDARFVAEEFPSLPPVPELPLAQQKLSLTSSATFPRPEDTRRKLKTLGYFPNPNDTTCPRANTDPVTKVCPEEVDVYEYSITSINLSNEDVITITPGQKVIFYVHGNIIIGNNGGIVHDCSAEAMETVGATSCRPTDFQIFADNSQKVSNPQICIRNNPKTAAALPLEAFIFAPYYAIGKTGQSKFVGAIWGKSWGKISNCGSVNTDVAVNQKAEWAYLYHNLTPAEPLPTIGQVRDWKQVSD